MTITDIAEKQAEERKREKKLVHLTNSLSHDFIESLKLKNAVDKKNDEYIIKSFLDFVFFTEHKEIGEVNEALLHKFFMAYAPEKLAVDKDLHKTMPETLSKFCTYLDAQHFIKNAVPLIEVIKTINKDFQKIKMLAAAKPSEDKKNVKPKKETVKPKAEIPATIGRNDPCPCGSGKKYKKCCGKTQ
jgi:uncharacterized protein YchJ